jgi:hypothetical protein
LTEGVDALLPEVKAEVLKRVSEFDRFTEESDPHGEHDFGVLELNGTTIFWKIKPVRQGSQVRLAESRGPERDDARPHDLAGGGDCR